MKKLSKKIWVVVLSATLIAGVGTAATLAMLNSKTQSVTNQFAGKGVNIGVVENGSVYENGTNTNSGYKKITDTTPVSKTVQIKNLDTYATYDTYVRVRLVPTVIYNDDNAKAGQTVPVDMRGKVTYKYGTDFSSKWKALLGDSTEVSGNALTTPTDDIYYYYRTALKSGDVTSDLITTVAYSGTIPDGAHFELRVLTEGIAAGQASSTTSGQTAFQEAWGFSPDSLAT